MTRKDSEWEAQDRGCQADLKNITGNELLQQMYYMCEGQAAANNVPTDVMSTVIAFDGMGGESLYMMMIPFIPPEIPKEALQ